MDIETFRIIASEVDEIDYAGITVLEQKKIKNHGKKEYFPYIAQHNTEDLWRLFFEASMYFNGEKNVKLLDVGCGTGRILKLAKEYGIKKVHGVEFYEPYVEIGKKIHGLSDEEFTVINAFRLDKDFLKQFNVIYTYMPIADRNLMGDLNMHLVRNASYPAIFVEMMADYYPVNNFKGSNHGQVLGNHSFISYFPPTNYSY